MLLWQVRGVTDEFGCFGEGPTNGFYPGPSPPGLIPGGGFVPGGGGYHFQSYLVHCFWLRTPLHSYEA